MNKQEAILKLQKLQKSSGSNVRASAFAIICELLDASSLGEVSVELRKLQEAHPTEAPVVHDPAERH